MGWDNPRRSRRGWALCRASQVPVRAVSSLKRFQEQGLKRVLIANRGEIAVRIARTASEMGLEPVFAHPEDDVPLSTSSGHWERHLLPGRGVAAYLDQRELLKAAEASGSDAIHPGYGFLAENADFARGVVERGFVFVGPAPETLELFGDKIRARAFARKHETPVLSGSDTDHNLEAARDFLGSLGNGDAVMIKAAAGGGGRGMRAVRDVAELEREWPRCEEEARRAFGNGALYVERLVGRPRHIEMQIAGDGRGRVIAFGERECSLQRRRQKIIEIAPAPNLDSQVRRQMEESAIRMATAAKYINLGTFEFLLDKAGDFYFIEANPRLQVEHTVTEEVFGIDLVRLQFELAAGRPLPDDTQLRGPQGCAIQARINAEVLQPNGDIRPAGGTVRAFQPPTGPGIRVDTHMRSGHSPDPGFDSLVAKVIVRSDRFQNAAIKLARALEEFEISGLATNIPFLRRLLARDEVASGTLHTELVEDLLEELVVPSDTEAGNSAVGAVVVGARVDASDPLAVLAHGKDGAADPDTVPLSPSAAEPGTVIAPIQGTVVEILVSEGDLVHAGHDLLIMEAMKMQHVIAADHAGYVSNIRVAVGDTVAEGSPIAVVDEAEFESGNNAQTAEVDLDYIRPDLAEILDRQARTQDERRPKAVERRRRTKQRTARENVEDLVDPGSFTEYGSLVLAARRQRYSMEELIDRTPADGLIAGMGRINGRLFDDERSRCMVMAYDYTVLAGTQGKFNHHKKDRMFALAENWRLPMVLFTEGGGGRPGDTDIVFAADLHIPAFHLFSRLSGLVPLVGIASGRCFAGNAVLLGCCDVVIATRNTNIGMGGPAMIEGGGLGIFKPEEVGPLEVQVPNGVVDIQVEDEEEAVQVAKQYLSYFQGPVQEWSAADQRKLRHVIPEDRLRIYDVRKIIDLLADDGSVQELRREFAAGMVTALVRIEGRPVGLIANNPLHLAGAVDSNGADKAARFMQLCDAFDIPILCLCDTPGNMVGPEAEKTALVRHCCRLYVIGSSVTVPMFTIVLRKSYGLGAQAMAAGSLHAPFFAISWPTGEFGGMGLEGAVKLGYRDELAAIKDPDERRARYEERVAGMYEQGKALNTATLFEIDDVIDPADTRRWIVEGLRACPPPPPRVGKKRPCIDTW